MQKIIQIYPCLLKLSRKQESVMDRQTDGRTDGRTAAITISLTAIAGGYTDKRYIRVYGNSIEIFQRNGRHSTDKGNVSYGDHIILDGVMLHKRPLRDVERPSRKYCMTVDA
jgi:hypothetical protein